MYTRSERTVKKYTVLQAFDSAKRRLREIGLTQVCVDYLSRNGLKDYDLITLEQLNEISDALYTDTLMYDGYKVTY